MKIHSLYPINKNANDDAAAHTENNISKGITYIEDAASSKFMFKGMKKSVVKVKPLEERT